jgi:carbohydrate-selective porin OprB
VDQVKLRPWLTVQLDAQFIKNPGADRTLKDALVFGFRDGITF